MAERPEFCFNCPGGSPFGRNGKANRIAPDCGGLWTIRRAAAVTAISGKREVRPLGILHGLCGRDMLGKTLMPEADERIIMSRTDVGMEVLIVSGPEVSSFAGNTHEQDLALLRLDTEERNRNRTDKPREEEPGPKSLTVIPGGADVAHVKAVVGDVIGDTFLDRLAAAVHAVEQARGLTYESLTDTANNAALGAIAMIDQVATELQQAIGYEQLLREAGRAYIEDLG